MRIAELNETLQPRTLKPFNDGEVFGHDFSADGRDYVIAYKEDGEDELYLSFTGEDSKGRQSARLLHNNKPFAVFSAVMTSMLTVIKEREPDAIRFEVESDEEQRMHTYDRLLDTAMTRGMFPADYTWDRDGNGRYWVFREGWR